MVSQIMASFSLSPVVELGQVAVTKTKTCLVFQVKREEKSADRENLMLAYSSLLVE